MSMILFKNVSDLERHKFQIDEMWKGMFEANAHYLIFDKRLNALKMYSYDFRSTPLFIVQMQQTEELLKKAFGGGR